MRSDRRGTVCYPMAPDGLFLSDECINAIETHWGALDDHTRMVVRYYAQMHAFVEPALKNDLLPPPRSQLKTQADRHRQIASVADVLDGLLQEERDCKEPAIGRLETKMKRLGGDTILRHRIALTWLASVARLQVNHPKNKRGRPSYARWRPFVCALARTYKSINGKKPSTGWNDYSRTRINAFWRGIGAIDTELPDNAKALNLKGLVEHAHRHRWFAEL